MLTGDLIRARVKGRAVEPTFVDPTSAALLTRAGDLVELFHQAAEESWDRAAIDDGLHELCADERDHKLLKGLAKVLADRAEFSEESALDPAALRLEAFTLAREIGPLALTAGPLHLPTAATVYSTLADRHGVDADLIAQSLYADRREEHRLRRPPDLAADALLHRYNVALVQSVLLRAQQITVTLSDPHAPKLRQLFRWAKFYQLLFSAERRPDTLVLTFDGPLSLFSQSTRYGMQLATFLPALLLQPGPWKLEAQLAWGPKRTARVLTLTEAHGLRSHLADTGAWKSREHLFFEERFAELDTPWRLSDTVEPVPIGGNAVLVPDYELTDGTRTARLELVGYWRRDWLERRLSDLARGGPGNLVLAVSTKLRVSEDDLADVKGDVIRFAQVLSPRKVLEAVERVATPTPPG